MVATNMTEQFDLPLGGGPETTGHVELFKSYSRFETYFDGAVRMRVVTYCDSPEFILELFDRVASLEHLEVVVGDVVDYRERLIDKPELADRLERLKRDGKLMIYLCENKEVHSKLYLIEYEDDTAEAGATEDTTGATQQTFEWTDEEDASTTNDDADDADDGTDASIARPATAVVGSPNLSNNAWTRQANTGVVFETTTETALWSDLVAFYEEHRSYNNDGPFLDDLTERLERTSDDRSEVVSLYTEGKVKTRDEVSELHGRLDERIESEVDEVELVLGDDTELSDDAEAELADQQPDGDETESDPSSEDLDPSDDSTTRINLSLLGHSDDAIEALSRMTDYDATLSGDSLTTTPQAVQQYKRDVYEVPTMRVQRRETEEGEPTEFGQSLSFHADGRVYRVGEPLPDDPDVVDSALADLEAYFETVDKYGNCNDADAVKAHMAEALLWMFWAPFVNRDAAFYNQYGIDLDKALPNVYIYGESDAGKGTFARFALSMISGGRVLNPVDADEVGKRKVRGMRSANTAFPVVVDDITKDTVNRLDTFRNYWGNWTPDASYPLFAFISNDKRPDEWFRNRSKILHFNVNFDTSYQGEAEVNQLIEQDNPLFLWFAHEMLTRELTLSNDDDALRTTRSVMIDLYEYADRPVPEWFPRRPAEQEHDAGRDRWFDLLARDDITTEDQGERLRVSFPEEMATDTYTYARDPPTVARVERRGRDLLIKSPDEFISWLGDPPAGVELDGQRGTDADAERDVSGRGDGLFSRVRGLFS
jgi:hypothetical protein